MIRAVIFDLDNTLIDFLKFKKACCTAAIKAMQKAGLHVSTKHGLSLLYSIYSRYGMEDPAVFEKFLLAVEGRVDYHKLAHAMNAYRKERLTQLHPYPGVVPMVTALKKRGIRLAIVTDAPKLKAWLRLTASGLDKYFTHVVALEDTGRRKPSRLPFRKALSLLHVRSSECLMVGDWPERDLRGARSLGILTAWARYGSETPKRRVKADYVLDSPRQLLSVFT
jgi:HAD superfamily hydrolase (TIGR02253 family)